MLKRILINNKKVPVPVPIRSLREALDWVDTALVPPGHVITRVCLNDMLIADHGDLGAAGKVPLSEATKLELQIDSPAELTTQTLDAMRNLASAITGGLKTLAVACWQTKAQQRPSELDSIADDLNLICELLDHVSALVDRSHPELAAIQGIGGLMRRIMAQVALARANSDWKACAKLLLNKLEPLLQDLSVEAECLQHRIVVQMDGVLAKAGNGGAKP
ncbi:MAG: hypothetical protein RL011_2319 [Pseudomonadota bacterium]